MENNQNWHPGNTANESWTAFMVDLKDTEKPDIEELLRVSPLMARQAKSIITTWPDLKPEVQAAIEGLMIAGGIA
jgi:hypothetical protein